MGANAGAIQAGQSYIEMFLDRAAAVKGLQDMERRVKQTAAALSKVSAVGGLGRNFGSAFTGSISSALRSVSSGSMFTQAFGRVGETLRASIEGALSGAFFNRLGAKFKSLGSSLFAGGAIATTGLGAITALLLKPIEKFSDFEQKMGRFQQVFKEQSPEALAFAKILAKDVRNSVVNVADEMTAFQAVLQGMKFDPKTALGFSKTLASWTEDLAAFENIAPEEALDRLLSGLNGMVVPVQRFGANVRVANLEQEALALGINKATKDMTQQERAMLRLKILNEALERTGIKGQARREANLLASVFRGLTAAAYDANVAVGGTLAPAVRNLGLQAIGALQAFSGWVQKHQAVVAIAMISVPVLAAVAASATVLGAAMYAAGIAIQGFAAPMRMLQAPLMVLRAAATGAVAALGVLAGTSAVIAAGLRGAVTGVGALAGGLFRLAGATRAVGGLFSLLTNFAAYSASIGVKQLESFALTGVRSIGSLLSAAPSAGRFAVMVRRGLDGIGPAFMKLTRTIDSAFRSFRQMISYVPKMVGGLTLIVPAFRKIVTQGVSGFIASLRGLVAASSGVRVVGSALRSAGLAATQFLKGFAALATSFVAYAATMARVAAMHLGSVLLKAIGKVGMAVDGAAKLLTFGGRALTNYANATAQAAGRMLRSGIREAGRLFSSGAKSAVKFFSMVKAGAISGAKAVFAFARDAIPRLAAGIYAAGLSVLKFGVSLAVMSAQLLSNALISGVYALSSAFATLAGGVVVATAYIAAGVLAIGIPIAAVLLASGALATAFVKIAEAASALYQRLGGLTGIFRRIAGSFSSQGGTLVTVLGNVFKAISEEASEAWRGISMAIAAGDLQGAVRVLWAYIRRAFAAGWLQVAGYWDKIRTSGLTALNNLNARVQVVLSQIFGLVKQYAQQFETTFSALGNFALGAFKKVAEIFGASMEGVGMWDEQKTAISNIVSIISGSYLKAVESIQLRWSNIVMMMKMAVVEAKAAAFPFKNYDRQRGNVAREWMKRNHEIISGTNKKRDEIEGELNRQQAEYDKSVAQARIDAEKNRAERQKKIDEAVGSSQKKAKSRFTDAFMRFDGTLWGVISEAQKTIGEGVPTPKDMADGFGKFWADVSKKMGFGGGSGGQVSFRKAEGAFADAAFAGGGIMDVAKAQHQELKQVNKNLVKLQKVAPARARFGR